MKTSDEMIKSLFERREEYMNRKSRGARILQIAGRAAVPLAAAAAVALTIVGIQKNTETDIIITEETSNTNLVNETDNTGTEPTDIIDPNRLTIKQLQKQYLDNTALGEDFVSTTLGNTPEFIVADNKICKLVGGRADLPASNPDSEPAGIYADDCVYVKSGLCDILAPFILYAYEYKSFPYATFYTCAENSMYKAVFINDILYIFYEIGDASYNVEGIEYTIVSPHLTPENGGATKEEIAEENGISIFRMYDISNNDHKYLTDRFVLYSKDLKEKSGLYLWEAAPSLQSEPSLQPAIEPRTCENVLSYNQLSYIMEEINANKYSAEQAMELISKVTGIEANSENDEEAYFRFYFNNSSADYAIYISADLNADTLTMTYENLITGVNVSGLEEHYTELRDGFVYYEPEPADISYRTAKEIAELAGSGKLTAAYLTEKGASRSDLENRQYRYTLLFEYKSLYYSIEVWTDVKSNILAATITCTTTTGESLDLIKNSGKIDDFLNRYTSATGKNYITSQKQFSELMDKIKNNTLTIAYMSEIADDIGSGLYIYSLYYGSEYLENRYFNINIGMGGDNNIVYCNIVDINTGNLLELTEDFCQYNYFVYGYKQKFKTGFTPDVNIDALAEFHERVYNGQIHEKTLEQMEAKKRTENGKTVYYFYYSLGDKMYTVETTADPSIPVTQEAPGANITESWLIDTDTGDKMNLLMNAFTIDRFMSGNNIDDVDKRLKPIDDRQFDMLMSQFVPENNVSDSLTELIMENFPHLCDNDGILTLKYGMNVLYYYRSENILRIYTPSYTYTIDVYTDINDIKGLVAGAESFQKPDLSPLELLSYYIDADGHYQADSREWKVSENYDLYRKYFFGTWEGEFSFQLGRPYESLIIDDSELATLMTDQNCWFGDSFYEVNDHVLAFISGSIAGSSIHWIDTDDPDTMYIVWGGLGEHNWIYSDNDEYPTIFSLTKTDKAPNEPKNGFLSIYKLHETARDYGIDLEMLTDIKYPESPEPHLCHDTYANFYPVYLVSQAPDKLVLKIVVWNYYCEPEEAIEAICTIEKKNGEWVRTIEFQSISS